MIGLELKDLAVACHAFMVSWMCLLLDRCTPILPMLAIAEAGGHSPYLAEAGEGHHLPGLGDLEGTSLTQGLTVCKRNKKKQNAFQWE